MIKYSCATYLRGGKPAAQRALQNLHDHDIVAASGRDTGASSTTTCSPQTSTVWNG
ncbi:hypothetical protein OIE68_02245 [Nocardia vinacea]|uniref:hypothetical protein n=1 Tax=Nocardia vinacea TaxID=96468 RepID=UPI002E0ED637|nr:hypothetical protein OIE68_02245 [Nocardia vinacea]